MIQRIYCASCAEHASPLHAEDRANGWHQRKVEIIAKCPANHAIIIGQEICNLASMRCDLCSAEMPDGQKVVAVTMWRGQEPGPWEQQYGTKV